MRRATRARLTETEQYPLPAKAVGIFNAEEWADIAAGNWEEWRVGEAITKRVATATERQQMFDASLDYSLMVNGRVEGEDRQTLTQRLFDAWNDRLGYKLFGF